MTRHDRAPLSPKNLAAIQMMVKALLGTGSIARYGTGAKQEGSIPPDFSNSLGIVVFNEYFFSGQSPMDSRQEAAIGINLSSTRPGYIFAINSLSKSEEWNDKSMGLFTTQGAVPWQVGNAIICAPSELQVITTIKNQTNYSGHFWDIYSNGPFVPEGPPQSRVKIQPSVLESLENRPRSPNSKIIVNRTIFWHNRLPELSY
ncbi:MAG: hypothetical protein LBL32_03180, partial [Holosporales bacterium]|nr:hypothetical protein [Holosporales bacterium]